MAANLRKQEFPASASQALQFIHSQVWHFYYHKKATVCLFSVTSFLKVEFHLQTSSPPWLNSSTSLFSSNHLLCVSIPPFCKHPTSAGVGEEEREEGVEEDFPVCSNFSWYRSHLLKLDQCYYVTLFQVLSEYFNSDADFNLLCSVFMIIFMVQGRDIDYKVINRLADRPVWAIYLGFNFGAPAFTSPRGELGGHPQLWGCVGHPADPHLHPQPQCGKVSRKRKLHPH